MEDEGRLTVSSDFGNLLRRHRLAAGLSQEALAERARMSSDGISAVATKYEKINGEPNGIAVSP
jgi:transcriptional regulator with XRE-family HTH domain